MKLVTYSRGSEPRAGVLTVDDRIIDLQRASAARGGGTPSDTLPADNLTLLELGQPALDAVKSLIEWVAAQDDARNDGIPDTQAHRGASVAGPVASSWLRRSGGALSYPK